MTNPTPPLTAETDAIDVVNLITKKILRGNIFVTSDAFKNYIKDTFEAYAAQQNAELVAEMKEQSHYVETLEAENERLKQAAALFREASFQGHSSHWDSQGTNGANCPACFRASSLRRQADDLLPQPPKEAT